MPFADDPSLAATLWLTVTRLGEAQLMLPTALALVGWLAWTGERRSALVWLALLSLAIGLTTASKIAFVGWAVCIPRLNFTGFSGHSMFSAAVFPLLLRCLAASGERPTQRAAIALGYAVAALVAMSRVAVGAHSPSEAIAGFALGSVASALALALGSVPRRHLPRWLLAVLIAAQFLNPAAAPSLPTNDMVTQLALWMSGREKPYMRYMMLRDERLRLKALQAAAPRVPLH